MGYNLFRVDFGGKNIITWDLGLQSWDFHHGVRFREYVCEFKFEDCTATFVKFRAKHVKIPNENAFICKEVSKKTNDSSWPNKKHVVPTQNFEWPSLSTHQIWPHLFCENYSFFVGRFFLRKLSLTVSRLFSLKKNNKKHVFFPVRRIWKKWSKGRSHILHVTQTMVQVLSTELVS